MTSLGISNRRGGLQVSTQNARYIIDASGKAVFLAGFHTWHNVQDGGSTDPPPTFDWDEFIGALVSYGCNATKLWASMETAQLWADPLSLVQNPQYFVTNRYQRTGPGNAADGKLKFDLTKFNDEYFKRLNDRAAECAKNGIYVIVQLFQGWQIEDKGGASQPFDYHPFNSANNINSVDGDPNADGDGTETHTDLNNNAWTYQQDFVEEVVTRLNHLPNVIYEISNEDTGSANNTDWQEALIDHIETVEASLPNQHQIMRTVCYPSGSNTDLDASGATIVSYNGDKADSVLDGDKVAIRDSDHIEGNADDYHWAWEGLCNGSGGVLFMDQWEGETYGTDTRNNATHQAVRANMGYVLAMAKRCRNLLDMTPQPSLSTTGYCLAKDHATAADYIAFQPGTGAFNLDLTNATGTLNVYWRRCSDGSTSTDTVSGGASRTLTPPWAGLVAVHVYH